MVPEGCFRGLRVQSQPSVVRNFVVPGSKASVLALLTIFLAEKGCSREKNQGE